MLHAHGQVSQRFTSTLTGDKTTFTQALKRLRAANTPSKRSPHVRIPLFSKNLLKKPGKAVYRGPTRQETRTEGSETPSDVDDDETHTFSTFDTTKDFAPHLPRNLQYTRRIEGLLRPLGRPVLEDLVPPSPQQPIATLSHGLERVLFNPGVHWLQDPRSHVYNFPTWLESIPHVKDYAFDRRAGFVTSSMDNDMWSLAKREGRTFAGSTSSLTALLSQIYFLISADKEVDTSSLSRPFQYEPTSFTPGQRMPASVILNEKDGVYSIDSDGSLKASPEKNVLTWMGTLLEKFLTAPPEEFSRLLRSSDNAAPIDTTREAYRYAKSEKLVTRSQLDCVDSRLPGTGVFDIKTRAALPIRRDIMNWEENSGYLIHKAQGLLESFEKEYYDLIRSAFLKYSFQARMGNMDGVMVAYHNTARIFGFQYIPLSEMDERLYGSGDRGERVFEKCITFLEALLTEVVHHFPGQSVRLMAEKKEKSDSMNVFLQPAAWNVAIQGPIPIVQLDVTAKSFAGEDEVRGSRAVTRTKLTWTLLYSFATLALPQDEILRNLTASRKRLLFAYNLPTDVAMPEMKKKWDELQFNPAEPDESKFNPALFHVASEDVQMLRRLARAGAEHTKRRVLERKGKPTHVLQPATFSPRPWTRPTRIDGELWKATNHAIWVGKRQAMKLIREHRNNGIKLASKTIVPYSQFNTSVLRAVGKGITAAMELIEAHRAGVRKTAAKGSHASQIPTAKSILSEAPSGSHDGEAASSTASAS